MPRSRPGPGGARVEHRYLVRFAYDGTGFAGWARQPGLRTVEGEIRRGLVRLGLYDDERSIALEVASRTDRGVSARANALTITSPLDPDALGRAMNGIAGSIRFTHVVEVPFGFRTRGAIERVYRYWERPERRVPPAWKEAARRLSGPLDIRSFGRGIPRSAPVVRTVTSVDPHLRAGWLVVDVRARSFVWGMVRKIVSALRAVEDGRLPMERLEAAVRGGEPVALPLAEPDRLVLWDVRYPAPWSGPARPEAPHQQRYVHRESVRSAARSQILRAIRSPSAARTAAGNARR
ncbi:MAG TPA: hypothetical protein VGV64_00350 [Thermoplasmata archaeon]|nr:hypothetical protein [Thermoplasmata archaeon]